MIRLVAFFFVIVHAASSNNRISTRLETLSELRSDAESLDSSWESRIELLDDLQEASRLLKRVRREIKKSPESEGTYRNEKLFWKLTEKTLTSTFPGVKEEYKLCNWEMKQFDHDLYYLFTRLHTHVNPLPDIDMVLQLYSKVYDEFALLWRVLAKYDEVFCTDFEGGMPETLLEIWRELHASLELRTLDPEKWNEILSSAISAYHIMYEIEP